MKKEIQDVADRIVNAVAHAQRCGLYDGKMAERGRLATHGALKDTDIPCHEEDLSFLTEGTLKAVTECRIAMEYKQAFLDGMQSEIDERKRILQDEEFVLDQMRGLMEVREEAKYLKDKDALVCAMRICGNNVMFVNGHMARPSDFLF